MNLDGLPTVHRLLIEGVWKVVTPREWWAAKDTGDIWASERRMSTRILELAQPDQFIAPIEAR